MKMLLFLSLLLVGCSPIYAQTDSNGRLLLPDFIRLPQQNVGDTVRAKIKALKATINGNPARFRQQTTKSTEKILPFHPGVLRDNNNERVVAGQRPGLANLDTLPTNSEKLNKTLDDTFYGVQMVIDSRQQWTTGKTLKVCFLDMAESLSRRIFAVASEWNRNEHVKFTIDDPKGYSDCNSCFGCVRVTTSPGRLPAGVMGFSDWSTIGGEVDSVTSTDEATMYFDHMSKTVSERELRVRVLHEFGHALGLAHEHQSPSAAACLVDSTRAVNTLIAQFKADEGVSTISNSQRDDLVAAIRQNYLLLPRQGHFKVSTLFDSTSVMNYALPASFFMNNTPSTCYGRERSDKLSANDIALFQSNFSAVAASTRIPPGFVIYKFDKLTKVLSVDSQIVIPLKATPDEMNVILKKTKESLNNIEQFVLSQTR